MKRFVLEGLEPVNVLGGKLGSFKFEDEDEKSFLLATGQARSRIWIRDTHRHFCETDYIEAYVALREKRETFANKLRKRKGV